MAALKYCCRGCLALKEIGRLPGMDDVATHGGVSGVKVCLHFLSLYYEISATRAGQVTLKGGQEKHF